MRPPRLLLAATILYAGCGDGGPSVPSRANGDHCIGAGFPYNDARKCHEGDVGLPLCYRLASSGSSPIEWMCAVSPSGRLYNFAAGLSQIFYYPGWTFGPAARTKLQPAFKSTLSAKNEARCEEALAVHAQVGPLQNPLYCVYPPGIPDDHPWPMGTLSLKAKGMTFTAPFRGDEAWTTEPLWNVQSGLLTPDRSYGYPGIFYVRWTRDSPPPRSSRTYDCQHAAFLFPTIERLDDHTVSYHLLGPSSPCPRKETCQVTVTGLAGDEGYPVSGKITIRNLARDHNACDDAVDIDGTFVIAHPEL